MNEESKKYVRQRLSQILNDKLNEMSQNINKTELRCSDKDILILKELSDLKV